ncbi:gamma-glutamyltransferase [Bacillus suaedae]|uniref:Glutathione hydrolase proenzyme n=1 Tax=Halalkalibacter suaedae TaxID=2822140 RepID=A0A941ATQ7_9BACI|nr:gamma-glutamyltransferase [Bacillus suaedae]MBP3952424.1 gamma-glutamyltransferase [Bacillus suaedae]
MSPNGMVTTPHYLASQAGMKVLENGGNAIEAAIAATSTISVVYPHMNGIGGDNFWLIYDAKQKEVKALNASGRSGENATIGFYREQGVSKIPARGYLSANTIPGAVAGWEEAFQYSKLNFRSSLGWKDLLQTAIGYAKDGFPVTRSQEFWTKVNMNEADNQFRHLQRFDGFRSTFLNVDGSEFKTGERMRQLDLAQTLEQISNEGSKAFYQGEIAEKITRELQENGGVLTLEDFNNHESDWVTPLSVDYRGHQAYNLPPNTQGMASLSILNILNHFDLTQIEEGSAEYYHLIIEATKLAFNDRDQWLTDPDFVDIPLNRLLSKEHGAKLANQIKQGNNALHLNPLDPKGDTVWLGFIDKEGNAVSLIQSIYHDFGSGIIPKGTGVLLQNRGSFFSLDPHHTNCLQPKKRTFHTLNPAMLLKDELPVLIYGTMGGEGQPQTQAALITRIIDYQFDIQAAIEAPRWLYGRTWGADSNSLKVESRIPEKTIEVLKQFGHEIEVLEEFTDVMGHAGAIYIDQASGMKFGGADPRGDGIALGN